jgi:hypothetical protein
MTMLVKAETGLMPAPRRWRDRLADWTPILVIAPSLPA